jgi:soluble lytic murein transglycosylase-like protein
MCARTFTGITLALAAWLLALGGAVPAAEAQVKARVGSDGTLTIYNEPPPDRPAPAAEPQRARAAVSRARPVPPAELALLIERYSTRHDLDPRLVRAVIEAESGYNPRARSHKGAMGLMQLMPATARSLAVSDPYDPEQNVRGGTAYLRRLMDRYGQTELALAAYNAGPEAVDRYGGVPPYRETRTYIERVLGLYGHPYRHGSSRPPRRSPKLYWVRGPDQRPLLTTELP